MIEAVGWQYFDTFFERCAALLAPDGAMLLQAITIDERAYDVEKAKRSFANTQVFPGGCLPSLAVISRSVARVTDMRQIQLEDITTHYVRTLRCWRENFLAQLERVRALATTAAFSAPGSCTWPTARAASAAAGSATCSCCWPSPTSVRARPTRPRRRPRRHRRREFAPARAAGIPTTPARATLIVWPGCAQVAIHCRSPGHAAGEGPGELMATELGARRARLGAAGVALGRAARAGRLHARAGSAQRDHRARRRPHASSSAVHRHRKPSW